MTADVNSSPLRHSPTAPKIRTRAASARQSQQCSKQSRSNCLTSYPPSRYARLEIDELDVARRERLAEKATADAREALGAVGRKETHSGFAACVRAQTRAQSLADGFGR